MVADVFRFKTPATQLSMHKNTLNTQTTSACAVFKTKKNFGCGVSQPKFFCLLPLRLFRYVYSFYFVRAFNLVNLEVEFVARLAVKNSVSER